PAAARLQVDCRVPPGHGEETAIKRVREVLGEDGYEIEFHEKVVGNGSRLDSPLMDAIAAWVGRVDPGARVVPVMLPAFTDSRTFRDAFPDVVAYGFFPQRQKSLYESWPLMHGKDERIEEAAPGRDGAAQRPARPRARALGRRGAPAGRHGRGRLRRQAAAARRARRRARRARRRATRRGDG